MQAAQYVRMSTEHQQFSIENQKAVIAKYAECHDFEIVQTYSDEARSGIDLARRAGLKRLLDDVTSGKADFRAVLVYDVSRWGRFQDVDESACYEFLCRRAGVNVVYCAESFPNDLSVVASLLKALKRTMAGEYLRDLSARVFAGQVRLVRKGYKPGGVPGYGLRRLLLAPDGTPKMVLKDGERKSLMTDRVTFALGPTNELRTIRKIYSLCLDAELDCCAIARWLNARRVPYKGGKWNNQIVETILTSPKYIGSVVYSQCSARLRSKKQWLPREQWIVQPNSFPAIVTQGKFEAVQRKLSDRVIRRSNERLLAELREFISKHGRATELMVAADPKMADFDTYHQRFGSFSRAVALATEEPNGGFSEIERRSRLKLQLQDDFARAMASQNIQSHRKNGVFRSSAHPPVLLDVAACRVLKNGQLRWLIRYPLTGVQGLRCITLRLDPDNKLPLDYLLMRYLPAGNQRYRFSEARMKKLRASNHKSLDEAVDCLLREHVTLWA